MVGRDGKGRFGNRSELAHRVAYRRALGPLAEGDEVTHTCGNFLCVNPRHLTLRERATPPPPNPSGLCMCGCGQKAPLAAQTDLRLGYVRGEPVRFIRGHVGHTKRRTIASPDYAVEDRGYETPCWIWKGRYFASGYPRFASRRRRTQLAHRAMFEQEVGPIPDGCQLDHLCQQIACIRPTHLEAVSLSEHARRGHARKRRKIIERLSREDIALIRASTLSDRAVASLLGIEPMVVHDIRS